jgi:syntaxin-binding protein 5
VFKSSLEDRLLTFQRSAPLVAADTSGDFLLSTMHPNAPLIAECAYGTLFAQRRGFYAPPRVELGGRRGAIPPQPQPVPLGPQSMLGSVYSYLGAAAGVRVTMSGEEADTLREHSAVFPCVMSANKPPAVAGGQRSIPKPTTRRAGSQAGTHPRSQSPSADQGYAMPDVGAFGKQITEGTSAIFGRLGNALNERG